MLQCHSDGIKKFTSKYEETGLQMFRIGNDVIPQH